MLVWETCVENIFNLNYGLYIQCTTYGNIHLLFSFNSEILVLCLYIVCQVMNLIRDVPALTVYIFWKIGVCQRVWKMKDCYVQARIQGGGAGGPGPPLLRQKKKRGEKGKGKKRKRGKGKRGKRKRDIKKLRCHNLFFCAYIGLHWPMGGGRGLLPQ